MILIPIGISVGATPLATAAPVECAPQQPNGPYWITADCVDPDYDNPVVDSETDLTQPVALHKVSGHFEGTDKRFTFYFPAKATWQGRFFDKVYPTSDENAISDDLAHGADAGAYTVQTNAGTGYRVDAAAAKFSRQVAARYYGWSGRIYGYIWGGSGGSYMTVGAMENTTGVWDGAVPFVLAPPTAIPNNYTVRALARLVLIDKAPLIADAVRPGSRRSPFAGLTRAQRDVLREVTKMGVPLRAWDDWKYLLGYGAEGPQGPAGGTSELFQFLGLVRAFDPAYADDFWSKPGYLGTEKSPLGNVIRASLINQDETIATITTDAAGRPKALVLAAAPASLGVVPVDYTLISTSGDAIGGLAGSLDLKSKTFTLAGGNSDAVLNALHEGASVRIDNKWAVAFTSYHRHQVPTRAGFDAWNQFRGADGKPRYPQRGIDIGSTISPGISGGGTFTGKITMKVILVDNLDDCDAFAWPADWYAKQVKANLGTAYQGQFRLWYNDHADHVDPHSPRLVNYGGLFKQALKDVAAWAEKGVEPARSTRYDLVDSQVMIPATADSRRGVQPVVELSITGHGSSRDTVTVRTGQRVSFSGNVEVPTGAGKVVATGWDFDGTGDVTWSRTAHPRRTASMSASHRFDQPGTYFVSLRATAQREGDAANPYTPIYNLDTVRVIVRR